MTLYALNVKIGAIFVFMNKLEKQEAVPVEKFYRVLDAGGASVRDLPFDETNHDWLVEVEDGPLVRQSATAAYSLMECFNFIETGLLTDDARLPKEALKNILGREDFEINSLKITQIQAGAQQGIFRVDCGIAADVVVPLVVGISRHRALNEFVAYDHRTIKELRQKEAHSYAMDGDDPAFAEKSFFPKHFGEYEQDGVYFYLAEFLEGYKEINFFHTGEQDMMGEPGKFLLLNGINQGECCRRLDEFQSSEILVNIAVQQVMTALKCDFVLTPGFGAGDYVYSPEKDRVVLHCLRNAKFMKNGFWGAVDQDIQFDVDPKAQLLAHQILQLIFWKEANLEAKGVSYYQGQEGFIFSTFDLVKIIEKLISKLELTPEQWGETLGLMQFWQDQAVIFFGNHYSPEETRLLAKRMRDVMMLLQMGLWHSMSMSLT